MRHQEANRLSGTEIAAQIQAEVAEQIKKLKLKAGLAVILVGNDPASEKYVSLKQKAAKKAGIDFHVYRFDENEHQEAVLETINFLNHDEYVHAILVQLPVPKHLDENRIISAMDPKKDVDGFHPENIKAFLLDRPAIAPGLVMGIIQLITATNEPLAGKTAVVIAKSHEFTQTMAHGLKPFGVYASTVRPDAEDLAQKTQAADIVVTAVGSPGWLTKDMVKESAILIDVGTSEVGGKIVGDVHASCKLKAAWISPVPGGVGPMTVAMLLKNTVLLARLAHRGGGLSTEADVK